MKNTILRKAMLFVLMVPMLFLAVHNNIAIFPSLSLLRVIPLADKVLTLKSL